MLGVVLLALWTCMGVLSPASRPFPRLLCVLHDPQLGAADLLGSPCPVKLSWARHITYSRSENSKIALTKKKKYIF